MQQSKVSVKHSKKTLSSSHSLIRTYSIFGGVGAGRGWGGAGHLFETGHLLTFSAFRTGSYSRWALIQGWALI